MRKTRWQPEGALAARAGGVCYESWTGKKEVSLFAGAGQAPFQGLAGCGLSLGLGKRKFHFLQGLGKPPACVWRGVVLSLGLGKRRFLICRVWASPLPGLAGRGLEPWTGKRKFLIYRACASPIAELTYWGLHQCGTVGPSMSKSPGTHLSTEKEGER